VRMEKKHVARKAVFKSFIRAEYGLTVVYSDDRVLILDGQMIWMSFHSFQGALDYFQHSIMESKTYSHSSISDLYSAI
jgi:L-amino acid N-acyltransferase YncA